MAETITVYSDNKQQVIQNAKLVGVTSTKYINGGIIPCNTPMYIPSKKPEIKTASTSTPAKTNPNGTKQKMVPMPEPKNLNVPNPLNSNPNSYNYKWDSNRTDKRVSLNCAPLSKNMNTVEYIDRIRYVLGRGTVNLEKGQTVYGFLHSMLSGSCGLIFPYTPNISINHQVNYDRTDITHSNLSISHYKNTPPPTISIDATFTADNRENALHMLSAIWFLRACTKCDFGEMANVSENTYAGMPPPILYLNGYNQVMDNIPVVITAFQYTLPQDKDYVSLGVNLDSESQSFNDWKVSSAISDNGVLFNSVGNFQGDRASDSAMKYVNGIATSINNIKEAITTIEANRYNDYFFNNWLPTELKFGIQLQIQPNLMKYKKLFNLDRYKMGLYNLPKYKTDSRIFLPNEGGGKEVTNNIQEMCEIDWINQTIFEPIGKAINRNNTNTVMTNEGIWNQYKDAPDGSTFIANDTVYKVTKERVQSIGSKVNTSTTNESVTKWSTKSFIYTFDRAGWTW